MPQIDDSSASNETASRLTVNRRGLMVKGGGLAAAASVAATGMASPAFAALAGDDSGISTVRGPYAIHGGSIVHGFIAAPRRGGEIDVIVVLGAGDRSDSAAEATARRYARGGYLAMAPDLHATFGGNGAASSATLRAKLNAIKPMLEYLPRSSGRVRFVNA
jgi:hypothetical protein